MAAGVYDFTIEKGATFVRTVTWYSNAAMTTPVVLTSYTAAMKIRRVDTRAVVATSATDITLTLGGAAGTIVISLSSATTTALTETTPGELYYDLELTLSGITTRLLHGTVTVAREATY